MTAAGPANCDTPSFGADGVGSLGGPITSGSSTSASGWNNYGYDVQARSYLPSGSPYSINRYQPRGGVWGPYHGSVNG
ncbi:g1338 [Coccomyxa elongata]